MHLVTGPQQTVILGNCIEVMRGMEPESVRVVITDPPAGIGFMGKTWDSFADYEPATSAGRNALRMLTSVASSDATVKALAAAVKRSKADAKAATAGEAKRTATAVTNALARVLADARAALRVEAGDLLEYVGLAPWARGFVVFLVDVWTEAKRVLRPGGQICAWALPKTADLAGLALRLAGFEIRDGLVHLFGTGMAHGDNVSKAIDKAAGVEREVVGRKSDPRYDYAFTAQSGSPMGVVSPRPNAPTNKAAAALVTAPATPEAERWHDWNTQLAPGHEQWLLARKPSPLNYAATAVEHGTGVLNIGATRVERGERRNIESTGGLARPTYDAGGQARGGSRSAGTTELGGYPSNVLLSHSPGCGERCVEGCPVLELDRQGSGAGCHSPGAAQSQSGKRPRGGHVYSEGHDFDKPLRHGDTGGVSRFFPTFRYQAKAKRRDIPGRPDLTIDHPTQKHPDLMRWLVRLLASPGAVVLDPFGGSGTTGVACAAEGFDAILIELNPASVEQARARIAAVTGDIEAAANSRELTPPGAQLSML